MKVGQDHREEIAKAIAREGARERGSEEARLDGCRQSYPTAASRLSCGEARMIIGINSASLIEMHPSTTRLDS